MTIELKCPFCGEKLYSSDNCYVCLNDDCIFCGFHFMEKRWKPIIELKQALIQAKQDLDFFIKEQVRAQTALIERTKELDKCQKDLEVAREALKGTVSYYDHYAEFDGETSWDGVALIMRNDAHQALEQIEHKE